MNESALFLGVLSAMIVEESRAYLNAAANSRTFCEAENWLFADVWPDSRWSFPVVCGYLDVDPAYIRAQLRRARAAGFRIQGARVKRLVRNTKRAPDIACLSPMNDAHDEWASLSLRRPPERPSSEKTEGGSS